MEGWPKHLFKSGPYEVHQLYESKGILFKVTGIVKYAPGTVRDVVEYQNVILAFSPERHRHAYLSLQDNNIPLPCLGL